MVPSVTPENETGNSTVFCSHKAIYSYAHKWKTKKQAYHLVGSPK